MRSVVLSALLFALVGCATVQRPPQPEAEAAPDDDPFGASLDETFERMSVAVALGDPEDAIEQFQRAQLANPDAPETQVLLANLFLAAGQLDEAGSLLDQLLATEGDIPSALYSRALLARATNDEELEQELLERAVASDPDHAEANASLGEIALRNRRFRDAEARFLTSLGSQPENLVALVGLANLKLREDEAEIAEELLSRAIESSPDYSFAYADRSRALAIQQELDAAEADLTVAIQLDPGYSWHYLDRGRVRLEQGELRGAIDDFSDAISRDPDIFLTYALRARVYDRLDEYDAAIADYRTALGLRDDYFPAYAPLAVLLFEQGRFDEAAEYFARAWGDGHPADPRDPAWALAAALSWKHAGDEDSARSFLEREAAQFPRPGLYWDVARYYISPGYDGLLLQQVSDADNRVERVRTQFYLAAHYELEERTRTALALYREIVDEDLPGFAETRLAHRRLARLEGRS